MSENRCSCSASCAFIGTAIAIVTGIIVGLLFFFGVLESITLGLIATLIAGAGAFAAISAAFLFARNGEKKRCLCRLRGILFTGAVGTFLTSLFALLVDVGIFSIISAIIIGLVAFFLILLISAIICLALCVADCD